MFKATNKQFIFFLCTCAMYMHTSAQITNNYHDDKNIPHLKIERSMIYTPDTSWLYNHHASVTHFKNMFIAMWSDGIKDEDKPGQRVVYAVSKDFFHWSSTEKCLLFPINIIAIHKMF